MFESGHNLPKMVPLLPGTDLPMPGAGPLVRIYQPSRSVTQSGNARRPWLLEFVRTRPHVIDPLMGWTGGDDPLACTRLEFPNRESAIAFAESKGWDYELCDPPRQHRRVGKLSSRYRAELMSSADRSVAAINSAKAWSLRHDATSKLGGMAWELEARKAPGE